MQLDLTSAGAKNRSLIVQDSGVAKVMNTTPDKAVPFADSTQTVRALSQPELDDAGQPRWYVVQLVASDRQVDVATMPRLEVFVTHRLYTVSRQQGTPQHVLRLGFFGEEASAKVVCGYLKTFYAAATVVRISAAEQARFAGPPRTTEVDVNATDEYPGGRG